MISDMVDVSSQFADWQMVEEWCERYPMKLPIQEIRKRLANLQPRVKNKGWAAPTHSSIQDLNNLEHKIQRRILVGIV